MNWVTRGLTADDSSEDLAALIMLLKKDLVATIQREVWAGLNPPQR